MIIHDHLCVRRRGRPSKKSPALLKMLLSLIARGRSRRSAAISCKISAKTLQRWIRHDFTIRELITEAEEKGRPLAPYVAWARHPFRGLRPPRSQRFRKRPFQRPKFHIPEGYRFIPLSKRQLK